MNDQTMETVAGVERLTLMKVCRLLREKDHRRAEQEVREAFGITNDGKGAADVQRR